MGKEASYLMFHLASGQRFHEGNKRTAIISTATFLVMNGYTMKVQDERRDRLLKKIASGDPSITLIDLENMVRPLVKHR